MHKSFCITTAVLLIFNGIVFGNISAGKDNSIKTARVREYVEQDNTIEILPEKTRNYKIAKIDHPSEVISIRDKNTFLPDRGGRVYSVDLLEKSGLTKDQVNNLIDNTALAGLSDAYLNAEKETGVNALFLLALSIHESDWGTSYFATTRNNLFGFCAYTSNPDAAMSFESKESCIMHVARYLKDNYLDPAGKYYNGKSVKDVNKCYATDPVWHKAVEKYMNLLLSTK